MNRRMVLEWFSRLAGAAVAAIVLIPGVRYITNPLRRRAGKSVVQRVSRLSDLPVGEAVLRSINGARKDAWTVYGQQRIGQVWLLRQSGADVEPSQAIVDAFSSVCPHLGCAVQRDQKHNGFNCPCHNAVFRGDGKRLDDKELGYKNPTPRGMDSLECSIVQDTATQEWWVEIKYEKFEYGRTEKVSKA